MMPTTGSDRPVRPFPAPPQDFFLPGILSVEGPKSTYLPLVFDSPHSGLEIPEDFHPAVGPKDVLISADTHVDDLFSSAPDCGAPLLRAHFPRMCAHVRVISVGNAPRSKHVCACAVYGLAWWVVRRHGKSGLLAFLAQPTVASGRAGVQRLGPRPHLTRNGLDPELI